MRWWVLVVVLAGCGGPDDPLIADAGQDAAPDAPQVVCGAGTIEENSVCVPDVISCGAGTHEHLGACVLDASVRILASNIRADGWSQPMIRVVETADDGAPIHERVLLTSDRATAGDIVSPAFALEERGGGSTFWPCNSATDASCVGPLRLSVARPSAPQTELAHVDLMVEAPPQIGSPTPCLAGGNIFYVDGTNYYVNGPTTYSTGATFDVFGAADRAVMHLVLGNAAWSWEMQTRQIGIPLIKSVYEDAKGIGETPPGEPTMYFTANGTPTTAGVCVAHFAFQIHEFNYSVATNKITLLTATFAITCDNSQATKLTGCVHFSQ